MVKRAESAGVIIPAVNEEKAIGYVLQDIPAGIAKEVVVVDNGSTDSTADVAREQGATVLREDRRGYGYACLKGIDYFDRLPELEKPKIIVFLDGDYSDYPEEMEKLIAPILQQNYDMVIGSRSLGHRKKGAMLPQAVFGNWLATTLLRLFYGARYTDLGPFRAIRFDRLKELGMQDKTFGWTVEMQLKAAKKGLKYCEVPVRYRQRIGQSKVTGTVYGTVMAGFKIIYTIIRYL